MFLVLNIHIFSRYPMLFYYLCDLIVYEQFFRNDLLIRQSAGKPFHKKQLISQLSHKDNKISLETFLNCIKHITILIIF